MFGWVRRGSIAVVTLAVGLGATAASAGEPDVAAAPSAWVGTWQTAMANTAAGTEFGLANHTIRNVVHTSIGGARARVRLSNAFGDKPVLLGRVTVAVASNGPHALPGTVREVGFGGAGSITVPAGSEVLSDPVDLAVPADGDLLVSVFTPEPSGPVTYHPLANQTSFLTSDGDHAADESGAAYTETTKFWHYVTAVDVLAPRAAGAVVTLGDSITDGGKSTSGANHRWPDFLADRLAARPGPTRLGVLNAGISGNRLVLPGARPDLGPNALARLDRDVLAGTGVRTVIVMEGINDITSQAVPDAAPIIAGLGQVAARAKAYGLRIIGGTLTPFAGSLPYTGERDRVRQEVNHFIRTSGVFDAVIDFDRALGAPADPLRLRAEYDSGDHLHPNDAGYRAMAEAVDLRRLVP